MDTPLPLGNHPEFQTQIGGAYGIMLSRRGSYMGKLNAFTIAPLHSKS